MLSQLDFKIFGWRPSKITMCMMLILKMYYRIVKKGEHGTSSSLTMDLCFKLTSYAYSSVRLLLLQEAHGGGLMGHFGVKKEDILATHFFWPKMRRDVERFVAPCTTCQKGKS